MEPKDTTLGETALQSGLMHRRFLDRELEVTVKDQSGIKTIPSPNEGKTYLVLGLIKRAPWDSPLEPGRATLRIAYNPNCSNKKKDVYTYLDQRLNDRVMEEPRTQFFINEP